jgi:tetratricopeptide (TPR) repeat protein
MSSTTEADDFGLAEVEATLAKGDRSRAIDLAIAAMGRGLEHPLTHRLVAEGLEQDGRMEDAAGLLHGATVLAPHDIEAKVAFARVLAKIGQPSDALAACEEALAVDPGDYAACMGAASASLALRDTVGATRYYGRAAEISPGRGEPAGALAALAARRGDAIAARTLGERALALQPNLVDANFAIARADIAEGYSAAAVTRLERVLARADLNDEERAQGLSWLADAFDALHLPTEALAVYDARTSALARSRTAAFQDGLGEQRIAQALRMTAWLAASNGDAWRTRSNEARQDMPPARAHVFLLSFPRSGATLLKQVLASHPDIVASDEGEWLARAGDHFLEGEAAFNGLATLGDDDAAAYRELYWRGVRESIDTDIKAKVFVDKNPLNSLRLPLIAKLFPDAKIIFALRDPRDVVLSCFRRLYYSTILEFFTLDGAARFYDQVMRFTDLCREKLPLTLHTVRHESLVRNFEREVRDALDFVGLNWNPDVWNFAARAGESATPSASQVARGLNAKGVGVWRRYRVQLQPVLPLLDAWVARYGYPPTPPASRKAPAEDSRLPARLDAVVRAVRTNDWPRIYAEVDAALAIGVRHPLFYRLRGVRRQGDGKLEEAIADFEAALEFDPADAGSLNALGLCLARNGRTSEGLTRLDSAIAIDPQFASAHYNRGWTLLAMGEIADARAAFDQALVLDPRHAKALGNLASIAVRTGDAETARAYAKRALALEPRQIVALTALASAEAAQGDLASGERRLREAITAPRIEAHERAVAQGELGDVLDGLGRPGDAFEAYKASNAGFRALYARAWAGRETSLGQAGRLIESFQEASPALWRRNATVASPGGLAGHVFLVGFPRSGTTMLGQALAMHPDVVTLEEEAPLADAVEAFIKTPDGVGRLSSLDPAGIEHFARLYHQRVRKVVGDAVGKVVVDKLPMNSLSLPLMVTLFPEAKILFLRRDPRDVVLSCFRRRFAINATTVEFLSLEGAASLYDAVMRLMDVYTRVLDLDLRTQSYETLVHDFDDETRAICDFIGLGWTPAMVNFAGRAGEIATPSAAQLARGLSTEGVGQWRRYRDALAPIMPILTPWVERFGYEVD